MLYAIRDIALAVPFNRAFDFLAKAENLPQWANAFAEVPGDGSAVMATPAGQVDIKLEVVADTATGVIDWKMSFPDGGVGLAQSRLIALNDEACVYCFILTPPPVALEQLEGALAQQTSILEGELVQLKNLLEA